MGSIYQRGKKLYIGFKGADGGWHYEATGLDAGKEAEAQKLLTKIERRVSAGEEPKKRRGRAGRDHGRPVCQEVARRAQGPFAHGVEER